MTKTISLVAGLLGGCFVVRYAAGRIRICKSMKKLFGEGDGENWEGKANWTIYHVIFVVVVFVEWQSEKLSSPSPQLNCWFSLSPTCWFGRIRTHTELRFVSDLDLSRLRLINLIAASHNRNLLPSSFHPSRLGRNHFLFMSHSSHLPVRPCEFVNHFSERAFGEKGRHAGQQQICYEESAAEKKSLSSRLENFYFCSDVG